MKNFLNTQNNRLDELIFENRNKNYGAYVLRQNSDLYLTKAMLAGIVCFVAVAVVPFVYSNFMKDTSILVKPAGKEITLSNVENKEAPVKPLKIQGKTKVNTVDTRLAEPKRNVVIDKTKPVVNPNDAVAGTQNIVGDSPENIQVNTSPSNTTPANGNQQQQVVIKTPSVDNNQPAIKVDVSADYVEGIEKFRQMIFNTFDKDRFEGENERLKATVTFIVETDGSITDIKVSGADSAFNSEALKTLNKLKNKGRWTPAKVKGESVRSYFKFPIIMDFE